MKHLSNVPKESDWFKICYDTLTSAGFPSFSTAIASVIWYFNSPLTRDLRGIDYGTGVPKPYWHEYIESWGSVAFGVVMVDVMYSRGADIPNLDLTISTTLISSIFIIFRLVSLAPQFDMICSINALMIVLSTIVVIVRLEESARLIVHNIFSF